MDREEILTKAIDKAILSGYYKFPFFDHESSNDIGKPWSIPMAWLMDRNRYFQIIFDHDFAKALWGEEMFEFEIEVGPEGGMVYDIARLPSWQYHLQQMVLSDDPIKYLEDYV